MNTSAETTLQWIGYMSNKLSSSQAANHNWLCAALCSALVGLSGLVPILFLPNQQQRQVQAKNSSENNNNNKMEKKKQDPSGQDQSRVLKWMLAFAVGSLLGDVFLHLLPEAYATANSHQDFEAIGLLVLYGLFAFMIAEKIVGGYLETSESHISASGYINLAANCVDNFCHGLAVGGSFLVSVKVGFMTTLCILIHEIPHEVGDFAILMKSGFTRYEAAKAQLSTAFVGIAGAIMALALDTILPVNSVTFFVVPFTSGGFLHISLVSVLPELMESNRIEDCVRLIAGIILGILAMALTSSL